MSSLREIQQKLCEHISKPSSKETLEFLTRLTDHPESNLSSVKKLDIYKIGYLARIKESLLDDFPETIDLLIEHKIVRSENIVVSDFLSRFPSRFSSIGEISEFFPDYVAQLKKDESFNYLNDLAKLEFLRVLSPLLSGSPAFNFSLLSQYSENEIEQLNLKLCPSFLLFNSQYYKEIGMSEYYSLFTTGGETIEEEVEEKVYRLLEKLKMGVKMNSLFSDPESLAHEFSSDEVTSLFKNWVKMGALTLC